MEEDRTSSGVRALRNEEWHQEGNGGPAGTTLGNREHEPYEEGEATVPVKAFEPPKRIESKQNKQNKTNKTKQPNQNKQKQTDILLPSLK